MKWTKDKCLEEALKYKTKKEFNKNSNGAYQASYKYGWLDEVTSHLSTIKRNFWIHKENCLKEALKYNILSDFYNISRCAYNSSCKYGWIDEITSHMLHLGDKYKRCIYSYEFDDNSVYIGLTCDLDRRNIQHYSDIKSSVYIHMNKTGIIPNVVKLTDYIEVTDAQKMEYIFLKKYKDSGYNILNKIKTGGIGGSIKWTKQTCLEEALKYNNYSNFRKGNVVVYNKCLRNKWLNEIEHFNKYYEKKNENITKQMCLEEALKYNNYSDFRNKSNSIYRICLKNNWIDEITHLKRKIPYTKEMCLEEALKYNNYSDFRKKSDIIYRKCLKNGWINEIKHFNK